MTGVTEPEWESSPLRAVPDYPVNALCGPLREDWWTPPRCRTRWSPALAWVPSRQSAGPPPCWCTATMRSSQSCGCR